jgi:hypothetical protein
MREGCKGSGASEARGSGGSGEMIKLTGRSRVAVREGESGRLGKA